ncbi:MAG: hypothetical protein WAN50_03500 [Minisyncoccia bacterium]
MKPIEAPKDRLYFSANPEIRETLNKLGFMAFDPGFMAAEPLPAGFSRYVAVEHDFQGPVMAGLMQRGATAENVGFVQWRDEEFDPDTVFAALLQPENLFSRDTASLDAVLDEPDFPTYLSGFPALDVNLKWRLPELVVMAGPYSSGKSLLGQLLGIRFIAEHGERLDCQALFCCFEDMAGQIRYDVKRHAEAHGIDPAKLLRRIRVVVRPPSQDRFIGWFKELVYDHAKTYNTKFVLADPWNEFDHERDLRQQETEYVRETMRDFRRLVDDLQIIQLFTTHVPKENVNADGSIGRFRIAQAMGSIHFANKADRGICVVRSSKYGGDHMCFVMDKVKVERLMGKKGVAALRYDWQRHTLVYDVDASAGLREDWRL